MKQLGALVNLNGRTNLLCNSYLVLNAMFNSYFFFFESNDNSCFKSFIKKYLVPLKLSIKLFVHGNGNLYLILILLIALYSVFILHNPSLFGVINDGAMYRLMLSLIIPFDNNLCCTSFRNVGTLGTWV